VFIPSLTGIGERVHLVNPEVSLRTHVDDVVNQIPFEDLDQIVLVGYSYGGPVAALSTTSAIVSMSSFTWTPSFPAPATRAHP
jgi:dienelactone hydrolase